MLNKLELQEIMFKSLDDLPEDDLDIRIASSRLRTEAETLYYLLKYPDERPLQTEYEKIVGISK